MKQCFQCHADDRELSDGTHFVRPELLFTKDHEQITPRQRRQGWRPRDPIDGRHAFERDTCMDCLNSNYTRRQLNAEQSRKARALEKPEGGEQNFYLLLADTDGAY